MADYYSHNDSRRKNTDLDYDTGSNAKWLWAGIVLVAVVALIALGSSGGGNVATDGAPAAVGDTTTEMAPAAPLATDDAGAGTAPAAPAPASE